MLAIQSYDERRDFIVPGDAAETIAFAAEHWLHTAERSILQRGRFAAALSGGSTPKAIFEKIAKSPTKSVDWSKVWLFWSDERNVPPDHPESNYRMAMESGLQRLPIPASQIFRMKGEGDLEQNALDYEAAIRHHLGKHFFDLVMLGVGEDGHTASLFPQTAALDVENRLVVPNFIPQKNAWRMTLTFPCINSSFSSAVYALGKSKQSIVPRVLEAAIVSPYPASRVGVHGRKTLWILDLEAGKFLPIV